MLTLFAEESLLTLAMVGFSGIFTFVLGLPLGILLYATHPEGLTPLPWLYRILSFVVNATRSLPFVILLIAVIPFTRMIMGTSLGWQGAIVPLVLAAIPFYARLAESAFREVPTGLIETANSLGANLFQIITKFVLPESLSNLIRHGTTTLINLVGYSAMAGAIGGGGLGSLAYHAGFQRGETEVMIGTVILLILFVQLIQSCGDYVVTKTQYR